MVIGLFPQLRPKLWNRLLPELRGVTSVDQFKAHLEDIFI